jgi:predicted transcriptional regulator
MTTALSEKPMQIKLPQDLEAKIEKIAAINHLSKVDVIRLCLAQAVPAIEANGLAIMPATGKAKAA